MVRRLISMKAEQGRRTLMVALAVTAVTAAGVTTFSKSPARAAIQLPEFAPSAKMDILGRNGEVTYTDEEWKSILSPSEYRVLRKAGTELPFSSALNSEKGVGVFACRGCNSPLFSSEAKYESGSGWPSFYKPLNGSVDQLPDFSIPFYPRTEVRCHKCKSHLGHVFDDGPQPTGKRFCMNGLALRFEPNITANTS